MGKIKSLVEDWIELQNSKGDNIDMSDVLYGNVKTDINQMTKDLDIDRKERTQSGKLQD